MRVNLLLPPQLWRDLRVLASKEGQSRSNFIRGLLVAAVQGKRRAPVTPIRPVAEPTPVEGEGEDDDVDAAPPVKAPVDAAPVERTPREAEEQRLWKIYFARVKAKTVPADSAAWKAWLAEQMANWVDPECEL